jgi:hypothetical protein
MAESKEFEPVSTFEFTKLRLLVDTLCGRAIALNLKQESEGRSEVVAADEGETGGQQQTVRATRALLDGRDARYNDVFPAMESNQGRWDKESRVLELLPIWAECVGNVLPPAWVPSFDELEALVLSDECNSFSFWLPDYTSYGSAVVPYAAKVNHSCSPNVCKTLLGPGLLHQFVATQDIKKGEALRWSYLDSTAPVKERKENTKLHYCFECNCPRCTEEEQEEEEDKGQEAGRPKVLPSSVGCGCGGWMYPSSGVLVCSMCMQEEEKEGEGDEEEGDWGWEGDEKEGEDEMDEREQDEEEEEEWEEDPDNPYDCRCGGWRFFETQDRLLCACCDRIHHVIHA